jgi:hypothetical protein
MRQNKIRGESATDRPKKRRDSLNYFPPSLVRNNRNKSVKLRRAGPNQNEQSNCDKSRHSFRSAHFDLEK